MSEPKQDPAVQGMSETEDRAAAVTVALEKCDRCSRYAFPEGNVSISIAEYTKLKSDAAASRSRINISAYRAASRYGIGLNPELANFIMTSYQTMTVAAVHAACVEKFGERSPSRSSIYRFVDKMRKAGFF
ncbi:helix-turn-helix domain-containing protein [Rhizobium sp. SL86]|uniref:helix-turn-helix domain-containing protein n=1 Tax=Rhizobium sp. SL86 TaxID=2995148 RepID=UPI002272AB72|nr:DUF4817 domain-containing protein [Rhizobium sp. SL86]MCY1668613.1 DUF4817 domain-containing protein [Rhizobium sp. SL86]